MQFNNNKKTFEISPTKQILRQVQGLDERRVSRVDEEMKMARSMSSILVIFLVFIVALNNYVVANICVIIHAPRQQQKDSTTLTFTRRRSVEKRTASPFKGMRTPGRDAKKNVKLQI